MSKNNTLCIAEWQAFSVEDIFHALNSCPTKNLSCHTEGEARSIQNNTDSLDSSLRSSRNSAQNDNVVDCHESADADSRNDNKDCPSLAERGLKGWIDSHNDDKLHAKATKIFKELKAFADDKGNHIFLNSYGKNCLKARNYVGLIQTKSGFCLEILPKTFRTAKENEGFEIKNCICSSLQDKANLFSCHTERSEVSQNLNKNRDISVFAKPQYDK